MEVSKYKKDKKMQQVTIASLNVCLSVCPPFRMNGAFSRSDKVAESIYTNIPPLTLDIICLQELVVNRSKVIRSFLHHPYATDIVTGSWHSNNIRFIQSGLTTLSRWPIIKQASHIFSGPSYHMEAYMAKAVQYSKIIVNNRMPVHVFNTHTQAWTNVQAQKIRLLQLQQIADFIRSLDIPKDEPIILCGDFNFDFYEHADVLSKFESVLNMRMHLPDQPQFSFDPTINPLVGTDDAAEYKTQSFQHGCYDQFLKDGLCVCCPKQLIDGIATSNSHLRPMKANVQVIQNALKNPIEIYINISTMRTISYISDHFPVVSTFEFDFPHSAVISPLLEKTVQSSDISLPWILVELVLFAIIFLLLVTFFYQIFKIRS